MKLMPPCAPKTGKLGRIKQITVWENQGEWKLRTGELRLELKAINQLYSNPASQSELKAPSKTSTKTFGRRYLLYLCSVITCKNSFYLRQVSLIDTEGKSHQNNCRSKEGRRKSQKNGRNKNYYKKLRMKSLSCTSI